MSPPIPSVRFDSEGMDEAAAYEGYAGLIGAAFESWGPERGFHARIVTWRLGCVMLHDSDVGGLTFARSPARIAADGLSHLMFQLVVRGRIDFDFEGVRGVAQEGDILCLDLARPMTMTTTALEAVTVGVARPEQGVLAHISRRAHGAKLSGEAARLLRQHVLGLREALPGLSADAAEYLGETTRNLLGAAFAQAHGGGETGAMVFTRVQQVLRQRLGDRDLTPETLAREVGVSRAALYRMFEPQGGVSRYLWRQRLIAARRKLGQATDGRTIAEIAAECGFASEAHFSRSFKEFFGETAREARKRLNQPLSGVLESSSPEFQAWAHELG